MLVLDEQKIYSNFIESLRAPKTKLNYRKSLEYYMKFHHFTKYSQVIQGDPYEEIKSYILDMKARQLSTISMKMHLCALKAFFEMNDIDLRWKKLFRFRGEDTMANEDRAYKHEEIQKMLSTANLRLKASILLMASSGMRIGALPTLKVGDLRGLNPPLVTVYRNTHAKYITFITPEARAAIDEYLSFRERCGEKITPDSPLFRNEFDVDFLEDARKNVTACSNTTLRISVDKNLIMCGLKTVDHVNKQGKNRKPIQATHGFRKFFRTQLLLAKVDPDVRELLMGHSKKKLELVYTRLTDEEMYQEYSKAIDLLTINPANRLQKKVDKYEKQEELIHRLGSLLRTAEEKGISLEQLFPTKL